MFRIRVFTPPVTDEAGWLHAGGEFTLGAERLVFMVDRRWEMRVTSRESRVSS